MKVPFSRAEPFETLRMRAGTFIAAGRHEPAVALLERCLTIRPRGLDALLLVREAHPLFAAAHDRTRFRHGFAAGFAPLDRICGSGDAGAVCSRHDLLALVKRRLADPPEPPPQADAPSKPAAPRGRLRLWRS